MHRYILTYGEYEDEEEIELLHSTEFSRQEFHVLVKKSIEEMFDNNNGEGMELLRDLMIKNYGFQKPSTIQSSYHCGNYGNWNFEQNHSVILIIN